MPFMLISSMMLFLFVGGVLSVMGCCVGCAWSCCYELCGFVNLQSGLICVHFR